MNSKWIDVKAGDGGTFKAYLSLPPTGRGPGILLIQEIFGVNEHIRGVADQYAMDGYTVLAPDVFWREEPGIQLGYDKDGFAKGLDLVRRAKFTQCTQDLADALKLLRGLPECTGPVASMGYCMGGRLSYHLAAETDVDAAVCYYGGGIPTVLSEVPKIRAPILLHFAENDSFIPLPSVQSVRDAFAGRDNVMIEVYEGVEHGFNCWSRSNYNQTAAALARGRTLAFLATNLPG
ncbi:carboxymethylenebutenolidase [Panacagrimonas perspica]|uniref:Carboxymethylenebutenolidase n=1 Tax=Panacagrimonas perspica TaxID=381431 RepID=A0A4S3K5Q0_9GAMM|nr:dienelactone hydrolase family protein [Panacagrimonas perspica]TDU28026.1 carboxymethylenebutenolidase [Panacagrimonas perspica]THD03449.1 carboxymethylenebutenolidase [Panacagrimonas perspica]